MHYLQEGVQYYVNRFNYQWWMYAKGALQSDRRLHRDSTILLGSSLQLSPAMIGPGNVQLRSP